MYFPGSQSISPVLNIGETVPSDLVAGMLFDRVVRTREFENPAIDTIRVLELQFVEQAPECRRGPGRQVFMQYDMPIGVLLSIFQNGGMDRIPQQYRLVDDIAARIRLLPDFFFERLEVVAYQ